MPAPQALGETLFRQYLSATIWKSIGMQFLQIALGWLLYQQTIGFVARRSSKCDGAFDGRVPLGGALSDHYGESTSK